MVHPRQNRIAKENWALGHDSPGDLDWTNSLCRHDLIEVVIEMVHGSDRGAA